MVIRLSRQLTTFFNKYLKPEEGLPYSKPFEDDLRLHNYKRFRFFSLVIFCLQVAFFGVLGTFYFTNKGQTVQFDLEQVKLHLVIFLIYGLFFLVSFFKIENKHPLIAKFLVRFFAAISVFFSIYLSLHQELTGIFNLYYLISTAIILIIFYWTVFESLTMIVLGNIMYYFFLPANDQLITLYLNIFNSFAFSLILFLVSRLIYKLKVQEFVNYYKLTQQADLLAEKNNLLENAEASLSSINKNLLHGVFRIDQNDRLVYVNDFFKSFLGFDQSKDLTGKSFDEILPHVDYQALQEKIHANGFVKNIEFNFKDEAGIIQNGLINCSLEINEHSQQWYCNGSIIDDTERKENENMLLNLSLVASKTDNAVFIIDKEEKIEWVNEGFTRITGYPFQEAVGKKPGLLFQGRNTDPDTVRKIGQRINNGESFMGEMLNYRKDSSEFWVHLNINPVLDHHNKIIKYIAVETDITERKRVEQELIAAKEQAENLIKVKEQFLSMVSHELRTPLNAVIGMSHMLLQENPRGDQVESMNTLKFSAEYLLSLINDILDFSKIEAGKISIESTNFNFFELIRSIKQTFLYQSEEKNLDFIVNQEEEVPKFLLGDPVRLNQVLTNLISNAIKFTDEGYVTLDIRTVKTTAKTLDFQFLVTDTGIGIPKDKLNAIFDRFEQASSSTTRKRGGTGLGLAITKSLVELMGGQIIVESEVGKGSVFSFTLKFGIGKEEESNLETGHSLSFDDLKGSRILLVEDNKINQLVALKFLRRWDLVCDVAENGKVALKMLGESKYDLILMDLQMPEMDGYEATKEIRDSAKPELRKIPIIALTAASLEIKDSVFEAGMNDFLIKPFNPTELLTKLKKYLDHEKIHEHFEVDDATNQDDQSKLDIAEIVRITNGDENFLMELLELCSDQLKELPEKIESALENQNWAELGNLIHKVKPTVKMLHNQEFEDAASRFSKSLENNNVVEIKKKAGVFIITINSTYDLLVNKIKDLRIKSNSNLAI